MTYTPASSGLRYSTSLSISRKAKLLLAKRCDERVNILGCYTCASENNEREQLFPRIG